VRFSECDWFGFEKNAISGLVFSFFNHGFRFVLKFLQSDVQCVVYRTADFEFTLLLSSSTVAIFYSAYDYDMRN